MSQPVIELYDAESMVLRAALMGLLPKADATAHVMFDLRCEEVAGILAAQFERQDSVLGTIETRNKLRNNVRYIDHYGPFTRAVDAIMVLRRAVPPMRGQRQDFLTAIVDATLKEAAALGLEQYKDRAHLAIYCALVARGPGLFRLPIDCPKDIMQPLGHVPSERELSPENGER